MTREFIELSPFTKSWKQMGLSDADFEQLQTKILTDPEAGAMIQGSGGIRKLRFYLPGKGSRGGCRVCYVDFEQFEKTYLLTAYAKKDRENLTDAETQQLRALVKELQKEAARRYYHG